MIRLHRAVYRLARPAGGLDSCPTVVIMDGRSVKTTERAGSCDFDAHKVIKDGVVSCAHGCLRRNDRTSPSLYLTF